MDLTIDRNNVEGSFKRIANEILLNYKLIVGSSIFEIVEIEFYFYCESHKDVFAHEHEIAEAGRLRLHGAGLDIVFSSNEEEYGGILIRSIKNVNKNKYINGPWNSAKKIISCINLLDLNAAIKFKKHEKPKISEIIQGKRIGLKKLVKSSDDNGIEMKEMEYRFVTDLVVENKLKNKEKLAEKIKKKKLRRNSLVIILKKTN